MNAPSRHDTGRCEAHHLLNICSSCSAMGARETMTSQRPPARGGGRRYGSHHHAKTMSARRAATTCRAGGVSSGQSSLYSKGNVVSWFRQAGTQILLQGLGEGRAAD